MSHFIPYSLLCSKHNYVSITIARYAVGDGISSNFLISEVLRIISCLSRYGFTVNNVTADGASENRSCNKALATHSVLEVFGDFLTDEQKKVLPVRNESCISSPNFG